jgi:hypothetical protein
VEGGVIDRLLHRLGLCRCSTGDSWHVDGRCVPIVTAQREREQRAVEEHHRIRKAMRLIAARCVE